MMLGHDAEHHDPNTAMKPSKIVNEPDIIYFINIVQSRIKIMSIINEIILEKVFKYLLFSKNVLYGQLGP